MYQKLSRVLNITNIFINPKLHLNKLSFRFISPDFLITFVLINNLNK